MQESCPPPRPPPASCNGGGGIETYVSRLRRKRNFAALHPHLKMHGVPRTAIPTADRLPEGT